MKIEELISAKEIFFSNNKIVDDQSRKRPIVYARTAFASAFKNAGPTKLGVVFGRNHASVLHYFKMHDQLINYDDYREMYNAAIEFRKHLMQGNDLPMMSHKDLIAMIKELRRELRLANEKIDTLYIYKEKQEQLKQIL